MRPGSGALAEAGAVEVILDPNPDLPRPRDFGAEQEQLLEIKQAYHASIPRLARDLRTDRPAAAAPDVAS